MIYITLLVISFTGVCRVPSTGPKLQHQHSLVLEKPLAGCHQQNISLKVYVKEREVNQHSPHHLLMVFKEPNAIGRKVLASEKRILLSDRVNWRTVGSQAWYASLSNRSVSSTT